MMTTAHMMSANTTTTLTAMVIIVMPLSVGEEGGPVAEGGGFVVVTPSEGVVVVTSLGHCSRGELEGTLQKLSRESGRNWTGMVTTEEAHSCRLLSSCETLALDVP